MRLTTNPKRKVFQEHPVFRTTECHYYANQTGMHINTVAKILKFFQTKSGKLSEQNFLNMYEMLDSTDEYADELDRHQIISLVFRVFDTDHDGYINLNEFMGGMAVNAHGTPNAKLEYAFKFYDSDTDGILTKADIKYSLYEMFAIIGFDDIDENINDFADTCMKLLDTDEMGQITKGMETGFLLTSKNERID
jgi:Ca2+-binding EF-hand superfamily protein